MSATARVGWADFLASVLEGVGAVMIGMWVYDRSWTWWLVGIAGARLMVVAFERKSQQ